MTYRRTAVLFAAMIFVAAACNPAAAPTVKPPTAAPATPTAAAATPTAAPEACHVGVAWATFQEERYGLRDKPGIEEALNAAGAELTDNDAANSAETQLANVEALLDAGIDVLILNSAEPESSLQSVQAAVNAGIPVIAYDRELESADALFMTHDNVGVGRMIAEAVTAAQPTGNYAIIKGQEGQTNPLFLREGFEEVIAPLIASGDITIPAGAEVYTDEWLPDNAQDNMETILTANDDDIQAVLVQNDGMAGGAIAALAARGLDGDVAVGGQDGDKAAINRVALGTQVVSVLKDATELGIAAGEAALQLCANPDISAVEGAVPSTTVGGIEGFAVLLDPLPITQDNLQDALDLNWLTEEELCADVPAGTVDVCP